MSPLPFIVLSFAAAAASLSSAGVKARPPRSAWPASFWPRSRRPDLARRVRPAGRSDVFVATGYGRLFLVLAGAPG